MYDNLSNRLRGEAKASDASLYIKELMREAADALDHFENLTIDLRRIPVIRCRECEFHDTADYGGGYTKNVCRLLSRQIQDDDYCSYALRKMRKNGDGDG